MKFALAQMVSCCVVKITMKDHNQIRLSMETDKWAATPIPFANWFRLQNLRHHKCCRAIKTKVIEAAVIAYQSLYSLCEPSSPHTKEVYGFGEQLNSRSLLLLKSPGWITYYWKNRIWPLSKDRNGEKKKLHLGFRYLVKRYSNV